MLDFTKAFDIVDHLTLLQKLEQYHLPNNILSWIVSFLSERRQTTKISWISSAVVQINRTEAFYKAQLLVHALFWSISMTLNLAESVTLS